MQDNSTKVCKVCGTEKPIEQFPPYNNGKRKGIYGFCYTCRNARSTKLRHVHKPLKPAKTEKMCLGCKQTFPINSFPRYGKRNGLYSYCKPCAKDAHRKYHSTPEGKLTKLRAKLKANYGMTVEQYDAMFQTQNGLCAICNKPETSLNPQRDIRNLNVDHCHTTGKVRSLLCCRCNAGIGYFLNDPSILRSAANYCETHQTACVQF